VQSHAAIDRSGLAVGGCGDVFSRLRLGRCRARVVCQIAYEELKPEIKARVDALVAIDPKFRTFAEGCTWPDVFPRQRPPEHFADLPRTAKGIEVAHPCPVADRCVISAILNDMRDLAFSLDVSDQLRLLKSLGHWVGDVHQPLHVSFDDDRGGNLVAVEGPCSKANLHAVWDKCIIEKKIGLNYADIAAKLRAEITDEDRSQWVPPVIDIAAVVAWANESSAIAERPDVQYCIQKDDACWYATNQQEYRGGPQRVVAVDDAYLDAQAATVRERLKKAGVRLAAILNTALTPG
jgi:hypothetical protein